MSLLGMYTYIFVIIVCNKCLTHLGVSSWYMFNSSDGNDHRDFEKAAIRLVPILEKIKRGNKTKILWYHQAPVLTNGFKNTTIRLNYIDSTKMMAYNDIAQRIFR